MGAEPASNPDCPGCAAAAKRIAELEAVLMSVLQTATLRGIDSIHFLSRLLSAPAGQEPLLILA